MNRLGLTKKRLLLTFALGAALCALLGVGFASCNNLSGVESATNNAVVQTPKAGEGVLSGKVDSPANAARTAMPTFPTISKYEVIATSGTNRVEGVVTTSGGSITYSIVLPLDITWTVAVNALDTNNNIVLSQEQTVKLTATSSSATKDFALSFANSGSTKGNVDLTISCPNSVTGIQYNFGAYCQNDSEATPVYENGAIKIKHSDVAVGSYNLVVNFYGGGNVLLFRIDQVVNVYAGLTTNRFIANTGSPYSVSGGKITVAQTDIDRFASNTIYVGGTGLSGKAATDYQNDSGSQFAPFGTLSKAITKARTITGDVKIIVQGNSGSNSSSHIDLPSGKTVEILGDSSTPQYTVDETYLFKTEGNLKIKDLTFKHIHFEVTGGTLEMENCEITGNSIPLTGRTPFTDVTSSDGGAIKIAEGATVTLKSCKINGNTATGKGGGIYNAGTLTIANSVIGNETATSAATNEKYSNKANKGAGIYTAGTNAKVTLDGETYIAYNRGSGQASHGGGVDVCDGATLIVGKDSVIKYNSAVYGGGICARNNEGNTDNSVLTMSGNVLNNKASVSGGGIYLANTQATIGSTAEISSNDCSADSKGDGGGIYIATAGANLTLNGAKVLNNTAKNNGGAIYFSNGTFTITGKVSIPYDATNKKNDVYIVKGNKIALGTNFGRETGSGKIGIKLSEYTAGTQVLENGGETINQTLCDNFILLDADGVKNTAFTIAPDSATPVKGVLKEAEQKLAKVYLDAANGDDTTGNGTEAKPVATLARALEILDTDDTTPTIVVASAYALANGEENLLNRASATGNKVTIKRGAENGAVMTISSGTVTIANVTFDGNKTAYPDNATGALLNISGSSTDVTIGDGAIFKDNYNNNNIAIGGAISNSGKLTINGGEISGNTAKLGGGIDNSGTLIITGGTISDNKASGSLASGGGIYVSRGTVTISGGIISGNTATTDGGGIYVAGNGTVEITGGTIGGTTDAEANTANNGGGIYNDGTLTITGGTITGNKLDGTANSKAKGIYNAGTLEMSGAAQVDSNNVVFLAENKFITVTDALTATTVANIVLETTSEYKPNAKVLEAGSGVTIDQVLCNKFVLLDKSYPPNVCKNYIIVPNAAGSQGVLKAPSAGPSIIILTGMTFSLTTGGTTVANGSEIPLGSTLTFTATPQILGGGTWTLPAETTYRIELVQGGSVLKYSDTNSLQVLSSSVFAGLVCDIRVVATIPGYGEFDQPITGVKLVSN